MVKLRRESARHMFHIDAPQDPGAPPRPLRRRGVRRDLERPGICCARRPADGRDQLFANS
ncbi:hypothetical protein ACP70R_033903 [Stipagrostis hirtigluma subsp. patula]